MFCFIKKYSEKYIVCVTLERKRNILDVVRYSNNTEYECGELGKKIFFV